MTVEILKTDKSLGIKKGERYEAKPYWLDPSDKVTLMKDGRPLCNQYRDEVRIMTRIELTS